MIAMSKILIASSDLGIRNFVSHHLLQHNYQVRSVADPQSAQVVCEHFNPDLVILDDNLSLNTNQDLYEFLKIDESAMVLILTNPQKLANKTLGFWQGCDDFLLKSFDSFLMELECRINALFFRQGDQKAAKQPLLVVDNLTINLICREVSVNCQSIDLTALEFDILSCLAHDPGRVWRREELIQRVWHSNHLGNPRIVDIHIGNLRKKLTSAASLIQTVKGVGYKFVDSSREGHY